jgi:hypothetical protein
MQGRLALQPAVPRPEAPGCHADKTKPQNISHACHLLQHGERMFDPGSPPTVEVAEEGQPQVEALGAKQGAVGVIHPLLSHL